MVNVALMALLWMANAEPGWEQAGSSDGVTVYARERKDTGIQEMRAIGTFDAPPMAVWNVLRDYADYVKIMPYVEVSRVVGEEPGGKTVYFYSLLRMPFIDRRDYVLAITDESQWNDGAGYLLTTWKVAPDEKGPPVPKDVVRIRRNDGYWRLVPTDGGKRTLATYYLYTDPGGAVPKFLVNRANGSTVPDIFKAIRNALKKK